jgi:hypothetical protein
MQEHITNTEILRAQRTSGKRFSVAIASWCLAGIAVLASFLFALAGFGVSNVPFIDNAHIISPLMIAPFFAWSALAAMTLFWLRNRQCSWIIPIGGTCLGLVSAVMYSPFFPFYVSAVPLACYLVYWHLRPRAMPREAHRLSGTP